MTRAGPELTQAPEIYWTLRLHAPGAAARDGGDGAVDTLTSREERPGTRRPRHRMPADVRAALAARGLTRAYNARPPYQRNDYLGWILRAKREETRIRRIRQMLDELQRGDRYMKMVYRPRRAREEDR